MSKKEQQDADSASIKSMIRTVDDNDRQLVRNLWSPQIIQGKASLEIFVVIIMSVQGEGDDDRGQPLLPLSAHPRTLHDLWIKSELGLGGRKSARLSRHEQWESVSHQLTGRTHVWELIKTWTYLSHFMWPTLWSLQSCNGYDKHHHLIAKGKERWQWMPSVRVRILPIHDGVPLIAPTSFCY